MQQTEYQSLQNQVYSIQLSYCCGQVFVDESRQVLAVVHSAHTLDVDVPAGLHGSPSQTHTQSCVPGYQVYGIRVQPHQ
jgi:hypothetical protein